MELEPYVDDLQRRLATAAVAAGDDARDLAERLTSPMDAAVRLVLLDALTAAAGEISAELAPGGVDVRLRGGGPEFVVDLPAHSSSELARPVPGESVEGAYGAPPAGPAVDAEGGTTRTTLRLPDSLKAQVEAAAARDGVSVNTWLVRAVAGALEQSASGAAVPPRAAPARAGKRNRNRQTGWVR